MSVNVNQRTAIILSDLAFDLDQQIEAAGYKLALGAVYSIIKEDCEALLNDSERVDLSMLIKQEPIK